MKLPVLVPGPAHSRGLQDYQYCSELEGRETREGVVLVGRNVYLHGAAGGCPPSAMDDAGYCAAHGGRRVAARLPGFAGGVAALAAARADVNERRRAAVWRDRAVH